MNPIYPDYSNCGVNLANSILRHFNAPTHHDTLPVFDKLIQKKNYKNILLILTDGLGSNLLKKHLPKDAFLRKQKIRDLSAVFPPTTTAATTSIYSGLTPMEHGWMGWNNYIPDIDEVVTMYLNTTKESDDSVETGYSVSKKYFPYVDSFSQIKEANGKTISIDPFGEDVTYKENDLDAFADSIYEACSQPGHKYIYAYFTDPDYTMHNFGTNAPETHDRINEINTKLEQLANKLKDTLIVITADHGHRDIKYKFLSDYPKLNETLLRPTSIETRAVNFFIKPNMYRQFVEEFHKNIPDGFILLTKQEVIDKQLFGNGKENPRFRKCLGDFMAISISDWAINDNHDTHQIISTHGGLTEDEMLVPFIAAET